MKKGAGALPVILILLSIGIVIGIFFYIFDPLSSYFKKQDEKRVSDLKSIEQALNFYYRDFGKYPEYVDQEFIMQIRDSKFNWGKPWKPYLDTLPEDPAFYKKYAYWSDRANNFQTFRLYTALERPDATNGSCGAVGCPNVPFKNMCGMYAPCNFGITSGNISP